jgi:hypothetical protein
VFKCSNKFVWLISHQPTIYFSQNKPAINNQPAVLFSQNKSAPDISHQPNEQAEERNTLGGPSHLVVHFEISKLISRSQGTSYRCMSQ